MRNLPAVLQPARPAPRTQLATSALMLPRPSEDDAARELGANVDGPCPNLHRTSGEVAPAKQLVGAA